MRGYWDWAVEGYSRSPHGAPVLILRTTHRGESSKDIEVLAWKERMRRGEISYVKVHNLNPPFGTQTIFPDGQ